MIKLPILVCCLICIYSIHAQDIQPALKKAYELFEKDPQLKFAVSSLTVAEALNGKVFFSKNSNFGLVPASSMKVLTAGAALEVLNPSFQYTTTFYLFSANGISDVYVAGSGDPTLASERFNSTKQKSITDSLRKNLLKKNIEKINGSWIEIGKPKMNAIPSTWIWEDVGNYYGAASYNLNWKENQYTIWLAPGKQQGDPVAISRFEPAMQLKVNNELITGSAQSGDQAYIFFNPGEKGITIKGSVPCCRERFSIFGAVPEPGKFALQQLASTFGGTIDNLKNKGAEIAAMSVIYEHKSPSLDTIVYWFLHKSINLYGEALMNTLDGNKDLSNDEPTGILREFWSKRGIDVNALAVKDGSGLSPSNRVTTGALVNALVYSKKQSWFPVYLHAFPQQNGMKIKSGSMRGVRAYAGYVTNRAGQQFCFSFIVNNYIGSPAALTKKMFDLLSLLKN